jgi:hypothetical protein
MTDLNAYDKWLEDGKPIQHLLKIDYVNGDYYVYITPKSIETATKYIMFASAHFPALDGTVKERNEVLQLMCTRDSSTLNDKLKSDNGIFCDRDEKGLLVRLNPGRLQKLATGELKYIMRRIDGDNKLWIFLED